MLRFSFFPVIIVDMTKTWGNIFKSQFIDRLYRYARTLLDADSEAEDAVHDVLERIWNRNNEGKQPSTPEAYAVRAVRNACIDKMRARASTTDSIPEQSEEIPQDRWSDVQLVRAAISLLPERQKTIIHLKDIEGYSTREIARILETEENYVRATLSRARKSLKDAIMSLNGTVK